MISDHAEIIRIKSEKDWHEQRSMGVGGSDVAALMGLSQYESTWGLWALKSGIVEKDQAGIAAKWGHRLEATVAEAYAEDTGAAVVEWPDVSLISKAYPFMRANLDRLIVEPTEMFPPGVVTVWTDLAPPPGVIGILECKTTGIASAGAAYQWDDDQIPDHYVLQVVHYGIVAGIHQIEFAALLGGRGLVTRTFEWDEQLAQNVIESEKWFWRMVETGQEPEVDSSEATEKALKRRIRQPEKVYDGGDDLAALWQEYRSLQETADRAVAAAQQNKNALLAAIGDAEVVTLHGEPLFTYRKVKGRKSLDNDALKVAHPEIYEKFLKVGASYPRFMPSKKGK